MYPIYTIGYGAGWSGESIRDEAKRLNAEVWDVRYLPGSMNPEWRMKNLIDVIGLRYTHVKALGNIHYRERVKRGTIVLSDPASVVERVAGVLARQPIIFLCGCVSHEICHRSTAAEYMRTAIGVPEIIHLVPPGKALQSGLKAITISQPYASLIALSAPHDAIGKHWDVRSRRTAYRGPIAIHAANNLAHVGGPSGYADLCNREPIATNLEISGFTRTHAAGFSLPLGSIVALAELIGIGQVVEDEDEDYVYWEEGGKSVISYPEKCYGSYRHAAVVLRFGNIRRVPSPINAKGAVGLWNVTQHVADDLRAQHLTWELL